MGSDFLAQHRNEFDKIVGFLKHELAAISAGRANPATVESIPVEVYNSTMQIKEIASITVPEARVLLISPWDKSITKQIINALTKAKLDLQILNDADELRLIVPQLTEEKRKLLVRQVKEKLEKSRIAVRHARETIRDKIIEQEKQKIISEDEKFKLNKELDVLTKDYTTDVEGIASKKENELITL